MKETIPDVSDAKNFALFVFDSADPKGGMGDFLFAFESLTEASLVGKRVIAMSVDADSYQVVDRRTMEVLEHQ